MAVVLLLAWAAVADATWSIAIGDRETGVVGAASVTCLTDIDLKALTPALVVGRGVGIVQASGDYEGLRRPVIFDGLRRGIPAGEILGQLEAVPGHASRQYGIVDMQEAVTFTGSQTLDWAGGAAFEIGPRVYALQGNILVGACVVDAMEAAVRALPDADIPTQLMAAMVAARDAGGDGRCSCSTLRPMSCGCPPASFAKSGHIGYLIAARPGDTDSASCTADGCADGSYFCDLNVPSQGAGDADPVSQLEVLFDEWRAGNGTGIIAAK